MCYDTSCIIYFLLLLASLGVFLLLADVEVHAERCRMLNFKDRQYRRGFYPEFPHAWRVSFVNIFQSLPDFPVIFDKYVFLISFLDIFSLC